MVECKRCNTNGAEMYTLDHRRLVSYRLAARYVDFVNGLSPGISTRKSRTIKVWLYRGPRAEFFLNGGTKYTTALLGPSNEPESRSGSSSSDNSSSSSSSPSVRPTSRVRDGLDDLPFIHEKGFKGEVARKFGSETTYRLLPDS